jgi:hypothetical protein
MQFSNGPKTFTAGSGGVTSDTLVKLSGADVVLNTATATDEPVGVAQGVAEDGEDVTVRPLNQSGTVQMTAAGAITAGADVYAAASGKIQALPATAGTYKKIGKALIAASGDGSVIEVLPYDFHATETVSFSADSKTLTAGTGGVSADTLVKLDGVEAVANTATSTDAPIGVAQATAADGEEVSVRLLNQPGTVLMTASGAITAGADAYAASAGKIQALPVGAGTYKKIGIALEAAATDGDVIEVLPYDYNSTTTVS